MKTLCLLMILAATPAFAETAKAPAPPATTSKQDVHTPAQNAAKSQNDKLMPYDFSPQRRQIQSAPKPGAEKPLGVG